MVFKFNNYSALNRNFTITFADGFAITLSALALPVFYQRNSPQHLTKMKKLNEQKEEISIPCKTTCERRCSKSCSLLNRKKSFLTIYNLQQLWQSNWSVSEISEIKTMKFIKKKKKKFSVLQHACFQIRKTLQFLLKISRRGNLTILIENAMKVYTTMSHLPQFERLTPKRIFLAETYQKEMIYS